MTRRERWCGGAAILLLAGSCADPAARIAVPVPVPSPPPTVIAAPAPATGTFVLTGLPSQGGLIRGTAPANTATLMLDGTAVPLAPDRSFVIGFDRDTGPTARLVATLADGRQVGEMLRIEPRRWAISRLSSLPKIPLPAPAFDRLRPTEVAEIAAARARAVRSDGWRQDFLWPAIGRISTLFGSQRIYANGEAGNYHSGIDIAKPVGSVVLAPADGVVVLASDRPFTLEGNLLMIDHGAGLTSALMHLSRIDVRVGDVVRRGQPVALSGATGRATGPHLHWGLKWRDARIDPLLVAGPMPGN